MKTNLLLLLTVMLLFSFKPKADKVSNLEYELRSLIRSFSSNANKNDCEYYFRKIDNLKDEIEEAIDDEDGDLRALNQLQKKTKAFYEFAATLTRCKGTSNELEIESFNTFINETDLSPMLIKRNGCAAIYKVNISGFQTYYAVNSSPESKALKISLPGSTFTMNIMCNSVEGFSQGEPLSKISAATITCSSANLRCFN